MMKADGRTIGCYLARKAYEHPVNHQISNPQEPLRTLQTNLHTDTEQLGRGYSGRHHSESSNEKSMIGEDAGAALGSLL